MRTWGTGDSSERAKPTGTTRAATSAAKARTRWRFLIASGITSRHVPRRMRRVFRRNGSRDFDVQKEISHILSPGTIRRTRTPCVTLDRSSTMSSSTVERCPALLSLAVHEFRTPATVVGGYLRMLLRDTAEPLTPHQQKLLAEAEKSFARLVTLIGELSEIGKLDDGQLAMNREPLELGALLTEVAEHVHEAKDRDVHLALGGDPGAAPVSGDAARLRKAFDAVFRAILREKPGPATVIADRRRAQIDGRTCAVVIVADTGSVQQSYDRPRGVFNETRGGLGLALPLARRVFEGHGGWIWSPAPLSGGMEPDDPLSRGSAIIALPLTE